MLICFYQKEAVSTVVRSGLVLDTALVARASLYVYKIYLTLHIRLIVVTIPKLSLVINETLQLSRIHFLIIFLNSGTIASNVS